MESIKTVAIVMGSISDYATMKEAADALCELNIPFEITVVSAHRTPDRMYAFAKSAKERGIGVIIAGAGGAAHLPGMLAAMTTLPVIGVPVITKALSGLDSLYSIVQMPPGVPVGTMAIGGARNAGLFAAMILGIYCESVTERMEILRRAMEETALDSAHTVENDYAAEI